MLQEESQIEHHTEMKDKLSITMYSHKSYGK